MIESAYFFLTTMEPLKLGRSLFIASTDYVLVMVAAVYYVLHTGKLGVFGIA